MSLIIIDVNLTSAVIDSDSIIIKDKRMIILYMLVPNMRGKENRYFHTRHSNK